MCGAVKQKYCRYSFNGGKGNFHYALGRLTSWWHNYLECKFENRRRFLVLLAGVSRIFLFRVLAPNTILKLVQRYKIVLVERTGFLRVWTSNVSKREYLGAVLFLNRLSRAPIYTKSRLIWHRLSMLICGTGRVSPTCAFRVSVDDGYTACCSFARDSLVSRPRSASAAYVRCTKLFQLWWNADCCYN